LESTASWELKFCVSHLYGLNENCAPEPTEGESTPQYKKKAFLIVGILEAGGTQWRIWLMHCCTSRNVAGSIPDVGH
jgi:hypothetical protein